MGDTSIQWTDKTWNPLRGCSETSPGCAHCYAATLAARFSGPGQPYEGLARFDANRKAHWTGKLKLVEEKLAEPLKWRKPAKVFVNSMSDLFHEDVPDAWIDSVFGVMAKAYWHTFQVLTKRADRMADYLSKRSGKGNVLSRIIDAAQAHPWPRWAMDEVNGGAGWNSFPYPNIHLGVSVEDQRRADERIPHLINCPAIVRFLSVEPMLGPIDLRRGIYSQVGLAAEAVRDMGTTLDGIHWVIVGGESGPNARPFNLQWARDIRDQCKAARVPYFFKQAGSHPIGSYDERMRMIGKEATGTDAVVRWKLGDSHGGDLDELPVDLRVRQFPRSEVTHV